MLERWARNKRVGRKDDSEENEIVRAAAVETKSGHEASTVNFDRSHVNRQSRNDSSRRMRFIGQRGGRERHDMHEENIAIRVVRSERGRPRHLISKRCKDRKRNDKGVETSN